MIAITRKIIDSIPKALIDAIFEKERSAGARIGGGVVRVIVYRMDSAGKTIKTFLAGWSSSHSLSSALLSIDMGWIMKKSEKSIG